MDDMVLLREYAIRNSEVAFETLMVEKVKQAIGLGGTSH